MAVGAASGKVKISFQAEKTDGPQKKKLLTSKSALPLRKPTWEERLKACQKGGGVRLDFARLSLGDAGLPKTAFSPALGLGGTLVGLNLKANALLSFPPYLCKALPMLQSLVLSNNSLTHLPDDLALLEHLEVLAIDSNAFEVLPPCVFAPRTLAASLLKLHCGANKLNSLPAEIGNLLALESLVVTGNQLESLPSEVAFLAEEGMLEDLDITGNPCTSPSSKWDPPAPIARLLGMRTVFRSQPQRAEAIQRSIALRKRLTARRAAIGSSAKS
jgi:Leucine-rich repeat (LRR) protein